MKTLKNPTDRNIEQHARGNFYMIPAGWQGELPDDVAMKLIEKQPVLVEVKEEVKVVVKAVVKEEETPKPTKPPFWDKSYKKNKGEKK